MGSVSLLAVIFFVKVFYLASGVPSQLGKCSIEEGKEIEECYMRAFGEPPVGDFITNTWETLSAARMKGFCDGFSLFEKCVGGEEGILQRKACTPPTGDYGRLVSLSQDYLLQFRYSCSSKGYPVVSKAVDCMQTFHKIGVKSFCAERAMKEILGIKANLQGFSINSMEKRCAVIGEMYQCTTQSAGILCREDGGENMLNEVWRARRSLFQECLAADE